MIDVTLERPHGVASVYHDELGEGKTVIHLGDTKMNNEKIKDALKYGVDVSNTHKWSEAECEIILSHETVHIILFGFGGTCLCSALDKIDRWACLHRELMMVDKT